MTFNFKLNRQLEADRITLEPRRMAVLAVRLTLWGRLWPDRAGPKSRVKLAGAGIPCPSHCYRTQPGPETSAVSGQSMTVRKGRIFKEMILDEPNFQNFILG